MYEKNSAFEEIPSDVILWKYMSLDKFIYLISENKLYFCRIDKFEDDRECTLTTIDKKIFRYNEKAKYYWERERTRYFISCWIKANNELALMWNTYGKKGIAIKTTVGKLIESLSEDTQHDIYISCVNYIDYKKESSQATGKALNALRIPMTKRNFFEQEKEVRLLYCDYNNKNEIGHSLDINTKALIEGIKVYPNAPRYFIDIVNMELDRFGFDKQALPSEI